jgi:hypothetical protein
MGTEKCLWVFKRQDCGLLEKLLRTSQLKIEDMQSAWIAFHMYQKERVFADHSGSFSSLRVNGGRKAETILSLR